MVETFHRVFDSKEPVVIKNDKPAVFEFSAKRKDVVNKRHRLFFKGESSLFYFWRSEADCTGEYAAIEDSLTSDGTHTDSFRLDYSSDTFVKYRKTAYKRINWPPVVHWAFKGVFSNDFRFGVHFSAENLKFQEDGFLSFRAEVFYKDNSSLKELASKPDEVYTISFDEGNYDFEKFEKAITLPLSKVEHVDFLLCGEGYSGKVYFEHPFLESDENLNVLPDFAPVMPAHEKWAWTGINLSKKEWPAFEILLNGKTVFDGEMFEKCHRYSDFELPLPEGSIIEGKNNLEIRTKDTYKLPFKISEVSYFSKADGEVCIEAYPKIVRVGEKVKVLVRTKHDNVTVNFESESDKLSAKTQNFEKAGLHAFEIEVLKSGACLSFSLSGEVAKFDCALEKQEDGVLLGTGDMIYINHEIEEEVENFLSWYMQNDVGNFITFRNVYRWGGGRKLNPDVWKKAVELLNALDMYYVHIVDGRNLPGLYCNPSLEMLKGKGFLGRQSHETDGRVGYWGSKDITTDLTQIAVTELWAHIPRENADIADLHANQTATVHENGRTYMYKKPNTASDMKTAHDVAVEGLAKVRCNTTRHTGPTTWFKYMYEAGYDWTGAELMYSSHEILSSALRGANYGYSKDKMGAHLAVQWSTTPHDDEYRYRRFRLALYLSYMNGYTDINTEEGLWHMEEFYSSFSRNSDACLNHLKQQQDLYRFIKLNTRRGEYEAPFAFVSGRYDGFNAFSGDKVWGQQNFSSSDCEKSWELIKEFYPLSTTGSSYHFPCPNKPIGHYTGTPKGNVDIVPIETHKFDKYKVLCFVGYNKMEDSDCEALLDYLNNGGRLIMGKCHLATTTERSDIVKGNLTFVSNPFTQMIDSHKNGEDVIVIPVGKGELTFIDREEFPANERVNSLYREAIRKYHDEIKEEQPVKIVCDETVQYAIYRDGENYDVYLLAVDWYNREEYNRKVILNNTTIDLPFGKMLKVCVKGDAFAYTDCENAVVTAVENDGVTVQGYGSGNVTIVKNGCAATHFIEFVDNSKIKIGFGG